MTPDAAGLAVTTQPTHNDDRGTLYWKTGRHASRSCHPGIYRARLASTW